MSEEVFLEQEKKYAAGYHLLGSFFACHEHETESTRTQFQEAKSESP